MVNELVIKALLADALHEAEHTRLKKWVRKPGKDRLQQLSILGRIEFSSLNLSDGSDSKASQEV